MAEDEGFNDSGSETEEDELFDYSEYETKEETVDKAELAELANDEAIEQIMKFLEGPTPLTINDLSERRKKAVYKKIYAEHSLNYGSDNDDENKIKVANSEVEIALNNIIKDRDDLLISDLSDNIKTPIFRESYNKRGLDYDEFKTEKETIIIKNLLQKDYIVNDVKFSFLFSNETNDLNFDDIRNKNEKMCLGPLNEWSNEDILSTKNSCYLIYTDNTNEKYLLGYLKYNINHEPKAPRNPTDPPITIYLSLSCVPPRFNGLRISSIMKNLVLRELVKTYKNISYIKNVELAELSGKKTTDSFLAKKIGLNPDEKNFENIGTPATVLAALDLYSSIESQLNNLHTQILTKNGGRKTNKKRKTNKN